MSTQGGLILAKEAIDLGIVVKDKDAALRFYCDTLGLPKIGEQPVGNGGLMVRLACGNSHIKIWTGTNPASNTLPGGPGAGATGNRYWTIHVKNLDDMAARCKAAGYELPWDIREIRPGVRVMMVVDPDGNWVELLQAS